MDQKLINTTLDAFQNKIGSKAEHVFLSPGRINIIGEHVDYADGFVLPAAIDKYVCFAILKNDSNTIRFFADDLNDSFQLNSETAIEPQEKMWANYLLGVLHGLQQQGKNVSGFDVLFKSTIPMGAGLSSSAAVECGFAFALNEIFGFQLSKKEIALLGQQAEHTFAGVNCGIMDQFASVFGKQHSVIKLDCNTLDYSYHSADFSPYTLLLLDSKVKHTHLTSGYNDRRSEIAVGLEKITQTFPEITSFRECKMEHLEAIQSQISRLIFKRCTYIIQEQLRVEKAIESLNKKDFKALGRLMTETHRGLSELYEVSCSELDF
ncbi:MAG: galactokinase, partial [Crocinitomicaceae bacterium]|nr:galactokinase [Crocinitomicaceae bacterium]